MVPADDVPAAAPWPESYPEGCRCRKVPDYNPRLGIYQCPDCKRPVRRMDSWLGGWKAGQVAERKERES